MKIYVGYNASCNSSHKSDEEYGEWSADYSSNIEHVISKKPRTSSIIYEEFEVACEIGEDVHVLSCEYSEGNSFGCSTGNFEILQVFTNLEDAEEVRKYLDFHQGTSLRRHSVITKSGNTYTICIPYAGYFESLENLSINSFVVE